MNLLNVVIEQVHEVFIIARIELNEHGVRTSGEMTFNDFGNLFQDLPANSLFL